ncbi:protein of unknown function [Candidatus Nitrosocosmicus franklandus]|uniref:Uncharacterized protein n=1 Tax=Candidatus Nitrosocosmicus franklandianus TaxID=1798806 RepID=A0A484IDT3_9ARCH|nr:protein of unknown function [Candidatus Nitrosocosmicus franklandus]
MTSLTKKVEINQFLIRVGTSLDNLFDRIINSNSVTSHCD